MESTIKYNDNFLAELNLIGRFRKSRIVFEIIFVNLVLIIELLEEEYWDNIILVNYTTLFIIFKLLLIMNIFIVKKFSVDLFDIELKQ